MVFGTIISSTRGDLSTEKALYLANFYLESARKETDPALALVLCHDGEVSLSHVKRSKYMGDPTTREGVASAYGGFGDLMGHHGNQQAAQAFFKKCEKWGGRAPKSDQPPQSPPSDDIAPSIKGALAVPSSSLAPQTEPKAAIKKGTDVAKVPESVFPRNIRPPLYEFKPPQPDARLDNTPQLVYCLGLMQTVKDPDELLDPVAQSWLQIVIKDTDEQDRLKILATGIIRAFKREEIKDAKAVTEVVQLAPVLESSDFRHLLKDFYSGIDQSELLDVHQLEGLAQLLHSADPGELDADDLVKILKLFSSRLMDTHQQSTNHIYQLTLAVSHVLDAMADAKVSGLDRETLHEPLLSYLESLKKSPDTYMVYQAAYAFQALLCVPDNESLWQTTLRRTGKVVKGVSRLVSAVKGIDLNAFIDGLVDIQQGVAGAMDAIKFVKDTYDDVKSLAEGGKSFMDCMKDGLTFNRKCAWYAALRGADTLIQEGQFSDFRKLACEAPCRRDPAFQWGVCQRLGELAVNNSWDPETRRGAITFLGEIYGNDREWGSQSTVKQWILNILMQLSTRSGSEMQCADSVLQELRHNGDTKKQALYRACQEKGPGSHPLKVVMPPLGHPSLLDRVQEKPDVEGHLRLLRRQRLQERGNVVYIPPQAKANQQARDEDLFPLMEKVDEFMSADQQQVFLLLGDSGSGKSTFNRQLEYTLWQTYKKNGPIPLLISLPSIEKPEHDMIAKQLRKLEFTEPQIREMKTYRDFILICDGYDESQQTRNLYVSNRLNQTGEWKAKMVISCRSEYVGADYRDRFQPGDRNHQVESGMFQEAVMTPFSLDQVEEYIDQYVSVHKPLWEAKEYKQALDQIPSLKDLVKNPFLMSLSLEVLPRMVDLDQNLSTTRVTRVSLYDHFIEHWLERGKKRLGEKNLSAQARAAFESLSDEGFTPNGIDFLKKLSVAIYKKQNGQPVVRYSRYKDEDSWKSQFFSRDDEKQLLREACPLTRSGNQHRFIHRSILEYGLALAVFDPQDWKERVAQESMKARRGSVDSDLSFMVRETEEEESTGTTEQEPDVNSPLVWRSYVNESSVLQFLEDRVHQEPMFKQQLLAYIEHSKVDKKWRKAAANAITILVRAGVQFINADLRCVQAPGADLSYGIFESAQFQGADLRHVDLRGAWLRYSDLSNAQMAGVRFGELPYLDHNARVSLCAYSPDGTTLSTAVNNKTINVYSTSTWELAWSTDDHRTPILFLVYSPTGNQLASCEDCTIRLWDIKDGTPLRVLNGHSECIRSIAYSPKGDQVASTGLDKTIMVWDVESGQCRHILIGHTGSVLCVVYSPSGDQIASSSLDKSIRLWNVESDESSQVLLGHTKPLSKVLYSPQGDILVSLCYGGTIRLWNPTTAEYRGLTDDQQGDQQDVKFSPKGNQLASHGSIGSIFTGFKYVVQLWDVATGLCLHTLHGHNTSITSITYSPNGDMVASASLDNTVRLWDSDSGVCLQILTGHSDYVYKAIFSPEGNRLVSISRDQSTRLWDVQPGRQQHVSNGHSDAIYSIKLSPKGRHFATGSGDDTVRLWDIETRSCVHTMAGHDWGIGGIAYSPHGDYIASGSRDKTAKLWSVGNGDCLHTLAGHSRAILCVDISPCGSRIVTGDVDGKIRLWNADTKESLQELNAHHKDVCKVVYSPRGDVFASCSEDVALSLWDAATGKCRSIMIGHNKSVYTIKWSPSGGQLASGSKDGSIRLWNIEAGTSLKAMTGHTDEVLGLAYSPLGDVVVSTSKDKTMRLWDVTSGQCHVVIQDSQYAIWDIDWKETADGSYLVAGSDDGGVWVFNVATDGDQYQFQLDWRITKGELNARGTGIQDVQGLSYLNKKLLKQRGAIGDPVDHLRETSEKILRLASVVSKLKTLSGAPVGGP